MGNNAAFSNFEDTILACYKHNALTKPLLLDLSKAFRDQDADSGGYSGRRVRSKDMYDAINEACGIAIPTRPKLPKDWSKWTPEQEMESEKWHTARERAFKNICRL